MRQKQEKCVVTFRTTAGAMAMERSCKEVGRPGRLISVPRSITAGCGMYYCTMDLDEDEMERFLRSANNACPFYRRGDDYQTARRQ